MSDSAQGQIPSGNSALSRISSAGSLAELEQLKVELLGKKGVITAQLKALSTLEPQERKAAGARINALRDEIAA